MRLSIKALTVLSISLLAVVAIWPDPVVSSTARPTLADCNVFPKTNPWNTDISDFPIHPQSDTYIESIGLDSNLHADFGENQTYGIPFTVVTKSQPDVKITFTAYGDESDLGPYPIPEKARIEAGSDHHVLVLDKAKCLLYELYNAVNHSNNSGWSADSGAVWDLSSNDLRPEGWTSADAAGLPILPGLVRYKEVKDNAIHHAIRFTAPDTQAGWIHPATHQAGSDDTDLPPMGLRVRLKADYDISGYTGQAKVILKAMKRYGMILADNGSPWYFTGATNTHWNDDSLNQIKEVPGSAFEAVYTGEILQ